MIVDHNQSINSVIQQQQINVSNVLGILIVIQHLKHQFVHHLVNVLNVQKMMIVMIIFLEKNVKRVNVFVILQNLTVTKPDLCQYVTTTQLNAKDVLPISNVSSTLKDNFVKKLLENVLWDVIKILIVIKLLLINSVH